MVTEVWWRAVAARQVGVVSLDQCRRAGMTAAAVRWKVTSGRWLALAPAAYLTTPGRTGWDVEAVAALLQRQSPGPVADVALEARAAGWFWGLDLRIPPTVQLVVPLARSLESTGVVRVRRSSRWSNLIDDRAVPARTSVPVTVMQLANAGSALDAVSVVARAVQKELVTPAELRVEIARRGGHRHSRLLLTALDDVDRGAESGVEVMYVRDVEQAHGLPRGRLQARSRLGGGRRHDVGYDEQQTLVEIDGQLGHSGWADRVRDGGRDRRVLGHGELTTRVFFTDVAVTPCATADEIAAILVSRGWKGRPHACRRRACALRGRSL